jgi:starch synthase
MKILIAASELDAHGEGARDPHAEGAMGVAVARLAAELTKLGHEVRAVVPLTRATRESAKPRKTRLKFQIPVGPGRLPCEIWEAITPDGLPVSMIRRDEFFDRSGLYGNESGDYGDNAARFIFFSKAVVELARRTSPDVLSTHGWQAALCAVFARESGLGLPVVLTPHGLDFQGNFWSYDFGLTNLPGHYFSAGGLEFYGSMNFLKAGIVFADSVALPGERFVAASQTPAFGCGLENVMTENASKLWGIPDGSAVVGWDPSADAALPAPVPQENAEAARMSNAAAFLAEAGLTGGIALAVCLPALSPELTPLLDAADRMVTRGLRMAVLGAIPDTARRGIESLRRRHASSVLVDEEPSEDRTRRALGGADFLLTPGPTNPLSPWLPRALRYGACPIAFFCEGFPGTQRLGGEGSAFFFHRATGDACSDAVRGALECMGEEGREALSAPNRALDMSLTAQALGYGSLFRSLVPGSAAA